MNAEGAYFLWGVIWCVCAILVFIYGFSGSDKDPDRGSLIYRLLVSIPIGLIFVVIIAMLKIAFISPISL